MAAEGLIVEENWAVVDVVGLNECGHLARVERVDSGVAVSGIEHDGGKFHSGLHVVIWRVLEEVRELVFIVG